MSTKIQFPNNRLTESGLGNPLFVTDVSNLTENLLEAINMLLGLASNGFAILSGFTYSGSAYSAGIVYMNGIIYYCSAGLNEGQYLSPVPTDVDSKLHSDGNSYNTYRIYYAVASNSQVGGMPQFTGNMDSYRFSMQKIKDYAASDATSKANAAESNAISAAALDATSKANATESNANNYTDGIASTLTSEISAIGDDWNNFSLIGITNTILLNSSNVSYTRIGKTVIMNINVNFNCQSAFSGNVIELKESGNTYTVLRPYYPISTGGDMYHNSNRTACYAILLDSGLSTNFGIHIYNYNGSDFTIGTSYACNFAIAYRDQT
jgi:hypothetical protein